MSTCVAEPKKLKPGITQRNPTPSEEKRLVDVLTVTIEKYCPEVVQAVKSILDTGADRLLGLHQDAFAAGYHDDEFLLLGLAIKYANLRGIDVMILHRRNGETP